MTDELAEHATPSDPPQGIAGLLAHHGHPVPNRITVDGKQVHPAPASADTGDRVTLSEDGSGAVALLSGLLADAEDFGDLRPGVTKDAHLVDGALDVALDVDAAGDEGLEASSASVVAHASTLVDDVARRQGGLTNDEREALRLWLYGHNGEGAGGLGGLWSAVERILSERLRTQR